MVRPATEKDAPGICDIYNYYIEKTIITFENTPLSVGQMADRIKETMTKYPFLVYESDGKVDGFAYASRWKGRCAYEYSVESTVYVDNKALGKGAGRKLYGALLQKLREQGSHSVIGGISLPNGPSIGLHESFGFEKVAHFKEVGYKFNKWIDVGYWELLLDGGPAT